MEQTLNIEEYITAANQDPATLLKPVLLPDLWLVHPSRSPRKI